MSDGNRTLSSEELEKSTTHGSGEELQFRVSKPKLTILHQVMYLIH